MSVRGILRCAGELVGFYCPGCGEIHFINTVPDMRPAWGFNGDYDKPTFTPSILVTGKRRMTEEEYQRVIGGEEIEFPPRVCHSFVTDGNIQFLNDCTHQLAGQTIPLPAIEE